MADERYEDFLGELPRFAPDTRQSAFLSASQPSDGPKKILKDFHLGKVEIANVGRGWPASAPDLGFLQTGLRKLLELGKVDLKSKKQVAQFVGWAVQRVVRTTVNSDGDVTLVRFWTKDDHGLYGYEFQVPTRGLD